MQPSSRKVKPEKEVWEFSHESQVESSEQFIFPSLEDDRIALNKECLLQLDYMLHHFNMKIVTASPEANQMVKFLHGELQDRQFHTIKEFEQLLKQACQLAADEVKNVRQKIIGRLDLLKSKLVQDAARDINACFDMLSEKEKESFIQKNKWMCKTQENGALVIALEHFSLD